MALIPCTVHMSNDDVRFNSIPGTDRHVSSDQIHALAVCDIGGLKYLMNSTYQEPGLHMSLHIYIYIYIYIRHLIHYMIAK